MSLPLATPEPSPYAPFAATRTDGARPWGLLTRVGFRFSFCYFVLYAACNGNVTVWLALPGLGIFLQRFASRPFQLAAEWCGVNVCGLSGAAARWHGGGSGDTALEYVIIAIFATIAALATVLWSVLDRRRPHYRELLSWVRLLLRITLGIGMITYGWAKLVPMQMREPSLAVLNNTYGNSSPMTLLWTLLGLHPAYEMVCGAAEIVAGGLILFRRTAALGVVLTAVVVTNIVLYNFFFDVPVKLYASHLLAMTGFLALPYAGAFWRFFVRHEPTQLAEPWFAPRAGKRLRIGLRVTEWFVLASVTIVMGLQVGLNLRKTSQAFVPPTLAGAWQIDRVEPAGARDRLTAPDGDAWSVLYFERGSYGYLRTAKGNLCRCTYIVNTGRSELRMRGPFGEQKFECSWPAPDQLQLKYSAPRTGYTVMLRRLELPASYPLTARGFHWISEWAYER